MPTGDGPSEMRRNVRMLAAKLVVFAISAVLALPIAAEPAQAQEHLSYEAARKRHAAPTAYDAQANPHYGFGPRVIVQPNDVVSGNRVIGRDPDPFIRGEILRHYDSGWPDP